MRLIGLTGGIASGKSAVAARLAAHGAVLIDADELARRVVQPGEPAYDEVLRRFGRDVVAADGGLDRARLGAIVFADADARADLERITHPHITALMQRELAAAVARDAAVVVVDIPLLFETSVQQRFEGVLLAYAPRAVQLQRLMARDGLPPAAAAQRVDAQMSIEEKRTLADWVIDNSGDVTDTERQVDRWWDTVIDAAARR